MKSVVGCIGRKEGGGLAAGPPLSPQVTMPIAPSPDQLIEWTHHLNSQTEPPSTRQAMSTETNKISLNISPCLKICGKKPKYLSETITMRSEVFFENGIIYNASRVALIPKHAVLLKMWKQTFRQFRHSINPLETQCMGTADPLSVR